MEGKQAFDATRSLRHAEIVEEDIILKHDALSEIDKSSRRKPNYKWTGPYCVCKTFPLKGIYLLEEFDGMPVANWEKAEQVHSESRTLRACRPEPS
jgi:hypothetical protein